MTKNNYRPEIDGLRALAILPVIVFHINNSLLPGGYLGVDIFFVISGFLITLILKKELDETNKINLMKFWDRRIKRICPLALFVIVVTSIFFSIFLYSPDQAIHAQQKLASLFSVANLYFWKNIGNYWGYAAESSPYLHYWSLSLEEQYYIFFPLTLIIAARYFSKKIVLLVSIITFGSFLLFIYGVINYPYAAFYLLPTRAWQLGIGCLLALLPHLRGTPNRYISYIGIISIVVMYIFPFSNGSIGASSLIVSIATASIISCYSHNRILENKLMKYIGKISFSLYLWHWPIIVFFRSLDNQLSIQVPHQAYLVILISFVMSVLSFHFIENFFRYKKYGTAMTLGFMLIGGVVFYMESTKTVFENYYEGIFRKPVSHLKYYDSRPQSAATLQFRILNSTTTMPVNNNLKKSYKLGGILKTEKKNTSPKIVVLGDSHGVMWCKLIDDICEKYSIPVSLWAMTGVQPIMGVKRERLLTFEERREYDKGRINLITKWQPDIIFLSSRSEYASTKHKHLLEFLSTNSKQVIIIESPPVLAGLGDRNATNFIAFKKIKKKQNGDIIYPRKTSPKLKSSLDKLVSKYSNIETMKIKDLFLTEEGVLCGRDDRVYYYDDDHLNDFGISLAKERFEKAINSYINNN